MTEPCRWDDCIYPHCSSEMGCKADENMAEAASFIGYFTIYGPNGYVEGPSRLSVELFSKQLLNKHPHALSGQIRKVWFKPLWQIKIWSRLELTGN